MADVIVAAVAVLLTGLAVLVAGVVLGPSWVWLAWVAVAAAPASLVLLFLGLRRILPR